MDWRLMDAIERGVNDGIEKEAAIKETLQSLKEPLGSKLGGILNKTKAQTSAVADKFAAMRSGTARPGWMARLKARFVRTKKKKKPQAAMDRFLDASSAAMNNIRVDIAQKRKDRIGQILNRRKAGVVDSIRKPGQ